MNKTLKEKREDFLLETSQHYNYHNRGVLRDSNGGVVRCMYRLDCAIGRKIESETLKAELDRAYANVYNMEAHYPALWAQLPEGLRELGPHFLNDVQAMHDTEAAWDANGLSDEGRDRVREICETHGLDVPADCQE